MTTKLAVFGNPVQHSLSPEIHKMFGEAAGIELTYEKVLVPLGEFAQAANQFFAEGGTGINITVPFKHDAFNFVDVRSSLAADAEAVNTIVRQADGRLRGVNTDGGGLVADLVGRLGWPISGQSVLILGAGGAVQGVLRSLLDAGPVEIVIANRTLAKAEKLVAMAADQRVRACPLEELSGSFDLIISASSAGLAKDASELALPDSLLGAETCLYDMVYGKETPFLRWGAALPDEQRADGLGMLVEQAAIAFSLWFDVKVETQSVFDRLRKHN